MSLKIAVFGTSRSGKDYTIRDASEILAEKGMLFTHISPISIVRETLNGRRLCDVPEEEKHRLIRTVRDTMAPLLENEYVFVDEHYAFPVRYGGVKIDNGYYGEKLPSFGRGRFSNRVFDVVYDEHWMQKYDLAIYMDVAPEIIQERFKTSEGDKKNPFITYEDIRSWQMFEIKRIRKICQETGCPLYFVYDANHSGEEIEMIVNQFLKRRLQPHNTITSGD